MMFSDNQKQKISYLQKYTLRYAKTSSTDGK